MMLPTLLLLALAQDPVEARIEELASRDIEVRSRAAKELLDLGARALPALQRAARHADPEIALRARPILKRIEVRERLTPALRAIEGLDLRLCRDDDKVWTEFFLEALPWKNPPGTVYSKLRPADLEVLVERAFAGARDDRQTLEVLTGARQHRLQRARGPAEALLRDRPAEIRAAAAAFLVELERDKVLERAEPFLRDGQKEVRTAVVASLGEMRAREAIPRLLAMKDDADVTMTLGRVLLILGSKEGTPLLLRMAELHPTGPSHVRAQATMYLGFYAGPEVLPQMRGYLKWTRNDPNSSYGAFVHLGNWGDRESIPLIEKEVREFKLWGNDGHAASRALFLMGATSSTSTLLKLAEEGNDGAIWALGRVGNPDAIPGLRGLLERKRVSAAVALAELGDRESIPAIRPFLASRVHGHPGTACTALALLDDVESAARIGAMEDAGVARRIWPALKSMDGPDGAALPEKEGYSGDWSSSEYQPALREGTNSTYGFPRFLGVRGAATARAGRSTEALVSWLGKSGSDSPGLIAAAALTRMGRTEGIPSLLEAERLLFCLNSVRRPEAWARLEGKTTSLNLYAPYEKIHRALAREAGLELEGPPDGSDARKAWVDVHQRFRKWGRPATLAEAFEMLEDARWSVVLEEDRLRIVPQDEALGFWSRWARTR